MALVACGRKDHLVPHKVEALKDSSISQVLMQNTQGGVLLFYSQRITVRCSKDERIRVVP
jgi:hypothetical protein